MKLVLCLTDQTFRQLQAISLANGLGFDTSLAKQQAVERLAAWLGGEEHLRVLDALPDEARTAHRILTAVLIRAWGWCLTRGYLIPNAVDWPVFQEMEQVYWIARSQLADLPISLSFNCSGGVRVLTPITSPQDVDPILGPPRCHAPTPGIAPGRAIIRCH